MKNEIKQEKQKFHKTFADLNLGSLEYKQLEKIFIDCVETVQNDIRHRRDIEQMSKKGNKKEIENIDFSEVVGYEQFMSCDKRRLIINFFLSNDIINLVHDTLFFGKSNNTLSGNNLSNMTSRPVSGRSKSVVSSDLQMFNKTNKQEDNKNNKTGMGFFKNNNFSEDAFNSTSKTLFYKTSFPKKSDKLVSEVKVKKPVPMGLSFNITGRIKQNNVKYYIS